jgi:hypothetical protein
MSVGDCDNVGGSGCRVDDGEFVRRCRSSGSPSGKSSSVFTEGTFAFTRAWSAHESTAGETAFAACAAAFAAAFETAFGAVLAFGAAFEAAFKPPFLAAFFGGTSGWSSDPPSESGCPAGISSVSLSSTQFVVVVCLSIVFLCCVLFDCLV